MKKIILILASIVASSVFASVTISVSTKTVQKAGGGGTITVTGTGSWTAVSDSGWITVKSGASGDGDGKVMFTVGENTTADTRIGHININDNVYTITQYGYTGTISPASVTVDRAGATGTISVTVGAGIEWSATPNVDWITVSPISGRNVGQVTYTVATYPGVVTRSGSITIAGQTFTVTQKGVDVSLEPAILKVNPEADIVQVDITALTATKWTVTPNADWVSVLDKEQGYGDYVLSLVVNANPSFAKRTTTVAVGTATLTIIQDGKATAELAIDPEFAEAPGSGAYGNVVVYATPDAPWTAESLTPWLTISQGKEGAGNGNIKYVVSPNPTLEERDGIIQVTPPYKKPEQDLYAGLVCWIPSYTSREGNDTRCFVRVRNNSAIESRSQLEDAADCILKLTGNGNVRVSSAEGALYEPCVGDTFVEMVSVPSNIYVPDPDDDGRLETHVYGKGLLSFWWRADLPEKGTYNRGVLSLYVDGKKVSTEEYNSWHKEIVAVETDGEHSVLWECSGKVNACYVDGITWESQEGSVRVEGGTSCVLYGGRFPAKENDAFAFSISFSVDELKQVNRLLSFAGHSLYVGADDVLMFDNLRTDFVVSERNAYYTVLLQQGIGGDVSLYAGNADTELEKVLECKSDSLMKFEGNEELSDFVVLGYCTVPNSGYLTGGNFRNFRFWARALNEVESSLVDSVIGHQTSFFSPKHEIPDVAWDFFPLDGNMFCCSSCSNVPHLVDGASAITSVSKDRYGIESHSLSGVPQGVVAFNNIRTLFSKGEADATYSFWFCVEDVKNPHELFERFWTGLRREAKSDMRVGVSIGQGGSVVLNNNETLYEFNNAKILPKFWYMLTLSGLAGKELRVYLNDEEIGNVSSELTLGYVDCMEYGNWGLRCTLGDKGCLIDDLTIYHAALTTDHVSEFYEASKANVLFHKVTQGIQNAQLGETAKLIPSDGGNYSVQLTIAQSVNWEAIPNCDWLHVTSDTEGAGSSLVTYTVDVNPYVTARTGTMTIAGVTLTIEQVGLEAEVECEKTFFDSVESDVGFINVYAEANGIWTAVSNDDWIMIDPDTEEGNGAGTCWFYIDDYPLTTQSRTGSITIAGKTVYITQSGYKLSIEPAVAEVGSNAGAGQIGVAASIDQVWDVLTDCDWIQIVSGRNGIGNGTVQYQFTDNTTGETRTGTIIIGGQKYTLTQRTTLPVNVQIVGNGSVTGTGNYNQGSKATLRAVPASGQVFSHWSGDAVGNDDSVEITVDIEKNVTATFIPEAAAQKLAEQKAAQGGFYTREQIHALEMGNLVFDVDASGTARVGVRLMETSDLSDPNSWKSATLSANPDVGADGTVGMKVKAEGNAKFFKIVVPEQ